MRHRLRSTSTAGAFAFRAPALRLLALAPLALAACDTGPGRVVGAAPSPETISGVVEGRDGPEAGVWVVAETDALSTGFAKIVVTDDEGRFLLPELPDATYRVWVRGYGLADSAPIEARPGDDLELRAAYPETPQEQAAIYPGNYWYSLMEVPPADEFPGTGPNGNGISPRMTTQAHWVDELKQGCQLCHQLGSKTTREITHIQDRFPTVLDAWNARVQFGQRGAQMSAVMSGYGRDRALAQFADWTTRIMEGEVPPEPPRPQGLERNVVLTLWDWGSASSYVHDEVASDKRNPTVNAGGLVYGVSMSDDRLLIVDPNTHEARDLRIPVREPDTESYFPTAPGFQPSAFWGDRVVLNAPANVHNPMMDQAGRVWLTSRIRNTGDNPEFCEGSSNRFARYLPLPTSSRQVSVYDPATDEFYLVDTCFATHHLQFAEDAANTLYFSGDTRVIGWVETNTLLDGAGTLGDLIAPVRDQAPARLALRAEAAQGWCPTVVDTNGDGRITRPWNTGGQRDPARDTQFTGFAYGIIVDPVDGSIWVARTGGMPGQIVRLERGSNPPETCRAEVYEPPFQNPAVPMEGWGFSPRGIDVDRNGVVWTALSGSGHMASFDRSKCRVTNGPTATGQHCPEGWTLYPSPGPQMKNVVNAGSADFHYYNWVDQFNTLGLGENVPIANGTTSESLLALLPGSGEWVTLRVPYPLGFYSRGLDGRIDDPAAGWKGRAVWADFGTNVPWHLEGGLGSTSRIVKFQVRPNPLAY